MQVVKLLKGLIQDSDGTISGKKAAGWATLAQLFVVIDVAILGMVLGKPSDPLLVNTVLWPLVVLVAAFFGLKAIENIKYGGVKKEEDKSVE